MTARHMRFRLNYNTVYAVVLIYKKKKKLNKRDILIVGRLACAHRNTVSYRICVIIIITVVCLTAIEQNVLRPSPRGPNDRGAFYFYCFSTAVNGKKTKSPYARDIFRGRKLSSSTNTRGTRSSERKKSTIETDSTGRVEISRKISRRFRRRFTFDFRLKTFQKQKTVSMCLVRKLRRSVYPFDANGNTAQSPDQTRIMSWPVPAYPFCRCSIRHVLRRVPLNSIRFDCF